MLEANIEVQKLLLLLSDGTIQHIDDGYWSIMIMIQNLTSLHLSGAGPGGMSRRCGRSLYLSQGSHAVNE
jgi:hypothetical protein